MAQIKIRPSDLVRAALDIKRIANNLERYEHEMTCRIYETIRLWEGAAESAFYREYFNEIQPFLSNDLKNLLIGIANQLNGVVNAIDDADADIASGMR